MARHVRSLVFLGLSLAFAFFTLSASAQTSADEQKRITDLFNRAFERGINIQDEPTSSYVFIEALQKLGVIDNKPEREDYRDFFRLKINFSFLGDKVLTVSHEYLAEYLGCCVNPGLGLTFEGKNKRAVETFAEKNFCSFNLDENSGQVSIHCGDNDLLSAGQKDPKVELILDTRQLKKELNFALLCKHSSGEENLLISTKHQILFADKNPSSGHGELELILDKTTPETYIYRYASNKPYANGWHKNVTGISINRQSLNFRISTYNMMPKFDGRGNRLPDERWDTASNYTCTKMERPAAAVDELLKARLGHFQETSAYEEKKKRELEELKKRQKI